MIELFISTSTSRLIFSIIMNNKIIFNYDNIENSNLSEKIMSIIEEGFNKTNISKNDVSSIYVTTGPGSFTGIRVGLTFAKVYASSINAKLIPISTLEMLASTNNSSTLSLAIIDARRNYVYAGIYNNNLDVVMKDSYILLDSINDYNKYLIISDDDFINAIKPNIDVLKIINKHRNDKFLNIHSINPNYLKNTEAEEKLKNDTTS